MIQSENTDCRVCAGIKTLVSSYIRDNKKRERDPQKFKKSQVTMTHDVDHIPMAKQTFLQNTTEKVDNR